MRKPRTEIYGTQANDTMSGTGGSDLIKGYDGNDFISASGGNDILDGGAGSDFVIGGGGFDTFLFNAAENLGAADLYDGGEGLDRLVLVVSEDQAASLSSALQAFAAWNQVGSFNFGLYSSVANVTITRIEQVYVKIGPDLFFG